jgi:hypothetical protein
MTERYAHLRPDLFTERDLATLGSGNGANGPVSAPGDGGTRGNVAEPEEKAGAAL